MPFNKPTDPGAAVRSVACGVLFAMTFLYLLVYLPEIIQGTHLLDLDLLRGLAVVGIAVVAFGAWENRELG